jgi:zinc protease
MNPRRAAPPAKVATVVGVTEFRLDNGLRLVLYPDQTREKVTVNITLLVGARHEVVARGQSASA